MSDRYSKTCSRGRSMLIETVNGSTAVPESKYPLAQTSPRETREAAGAGHREPADPDKSNSRPGDSSGTGGFSDATGMKSRGVVDSSVPARSKGSCLRIGAALRGKPAVLRP